MFFTLKSELHEPLLININDDSTFGELKTELEYHLNISKVMQKISSLKEDYEDDDIIKDSLLNEEINGGVLLINVYHSNSVEAEFFGFLHVFQKEELAQTNLKNLENNLEKNNLEKVQFTEKNGTIIIESSEDSQSESSSDNTTEDEDEDEDEENDDHAHDDDRDDTEIANSSEGGADEIKASLRLSSYRKSGHANDVNLRKRKSELDEIQCKKSKTSLKHKEYFYKYLEDEPPTHNTFKITSGNEEKIMENVQAAANKTFDAIDSSDMEYFTPMKALLPFDAKTSTPATPLNKASHLDDSKKPPYCLVQPEKRKCIIVVINMPNDSPSEYESFFKKFLPAFKHKMAADLRFHPSLPVAVFEDKLWISCSNIITHNWALNTITQLFDNQFMAESLSSFYKMKKVSVVMPNVGQLHDWLEIFKVMEMQNPGLNTDMWIVSEIKDLKWTDKDCGNLVRPNVVAHLLIDKPSIEFLKKHNFNLFYSFWILNLILLPEQQNPN